MERLSDSDLWSRVDRGAPDLDGYLAEHPEDRARVDELRALVGGVRAAEAADPNAASADPERIGPYRIVGRLGAGGMGIVYDAREEHPPRAVALKVQRPGLGGGRARALFEREIRTLARLEHPGIARLYAAGEHDGAPWFAMERVEGRPLDAWVRARRLGRRERLRLFVQVARTVAFAHAAGVVHRDLKPQNVLVTDDGTPRVLDFGLARWTDAQGSLVSASGDGPLGTLAYTSPEQARGEDVDERSDVYALGAILYELLADRRPRELDGLSLFAAMRVVGDREPRPLDQVARAVPAELRAVVARALAHAPTERYPSAAALGDDVERWLAGAPVLASRPTWRRRLWKRVRRHALVSALLAALALLGVFALYQSAIPTTWLADVPVSGGSHRSPFAHLAWRGDTPLVRVAGDERLYELERIDDLDVDYVIGTMKQWEGERWRKRFSEDLVHALNRLGCWVLFSVDLGVIDVETRERRVLTDAPLSHELRRRIWSDRNRWPVELRLTDDGRVVVSLEGRDRELVALAGVPVERLVATAREHDLVDDVAFRVERYAGAVGEPGPVRVVREPGERIAGSELYDALCEALGRSPGRTIEVVVRDPATGAEQTLELDRFASGAEAR